ncbi:MAG TPA: nucleotide disphospho-sugar-binding domain-containing protein [Actinocrinis sp.]|uniref:nucleotide disphospho-sugar-binding domain-containing protein n=1 Tax=Actinocrinis sp. TaxID=1920516 RepID=UPI002DDCA31A|nr:nucleotide disphospho-sugar-binding domain-containing protein [Actinocrinis sp.]HEV2345538.1 nucleotide disphospho-sugar-binding domain-containing protein [Actinocrinis sp.]
MIVIGRELRSRGHRVSVISTLDAQEEVLRGNLEFIPVGAEEYPLGALERFTDKQGKLTGVRAIRFIIKDMANIALMHGRELPGAVTRNGIEALVVDQIQPVGGAVALRYDLPYVNVCSLLPLNTDPGVPPWTMAWPYQDSNQARARNKIAYRVRSLMQRPLARADNLTRAAWGLPTMTMNPDQTFSTLAQIAQIPEFFDFPRTQMPESFHYAGPLHDYESASPVQFPWERLDGRPLIYASMGTLLNRRERVFRTIAEACENLDAQLVISLGHRGAHIPTDFPGQPVIVDYAPQLELLKRASLVIGHGGANTVLESMAYGVPMVLLPVSYDQPGVAARAKRVGVAEFIPVHKANTRRLRTTIDTVLTNPSYRQNAQTYQNEIRGADAVGRAADIIEQAFRTRRPVLRTTTA